MQRDDDCEISRNGGKSSTSNSKTKQVKDIVLDDGTGGGGGGASFIFLLNAAQVAVPLLVAAGGGGLGVGHFIQDNQQHGKINDNTRAEVSGNRNGEQNVTGGAGTHRNTENKIWKCRMLLFNFNSHFVRFSVFACVSVAVAVAVET